jgi:hypothetical protein
MRDRVKFWCNSVSQGVAQLDSAAGWVGLVVIVLGVAAGIAVPLVFSLSPWLTAVVLMGLFIVVVLEGAYRVWHATDQQLNAAKGEIERRFAAMRYALRITDLIPNLITGPDIMDVQLGLKIMNSSDEYIRYEIESVFTVIDGKRSPDGPILATSAIIPPHEIDTFMPPAAPGAPLNWQMGSLSLTIRYGHASQPPRYRGHWDYAVQAMREPGFAPGQISRVNVAPVSASEVEEI